MRERFPNHKNTSCFYIFYNFNYTTGSTFCPSCVGYKMDLDGSYVTFTHANVIYIRMQMLHI